MKSRLALLCIRHFFYRQDVHVMIYYCLVYLGLFLIYIKYLKLLTIENTVLIFQFYK